MESIIKFSVPSLTYKYSLNLRGRQKYGTPIERNHYIEHVD